MESETRRVGIIGIEGFPLLSMASTIEPLRAANLLAGRKLYEISFLGGSSSGRSSVGLTVPGAVPLFGAGPQDYVFVVAGGDPFSVRDSILFQWLKEQDEAGTVLAGVSGGPVILARARLMDGFRMTVHWEHRERLKQLLPSLVISRALYVSDRKRLTCAGGIAAADMMHAMISNHHGSEFANKVSDWFLHTEIRASSRPQRSTMSARFGAKDRKVQNGIQYIQDNIGKKLTLEELAENCNLSKRQLTRRFLNDVGHTPMRLANILRLETGMELLTTTRMSVTEIAYALEFSSSAHFTTLFGRHFGETPSQARARQTENIDQ